MEINLFDRIKNELIAVRASLSEKGLTPTLQSALLRNQQVLESYYDKLIKSSGIVSSKEQADINDEIIQAKRTQMENDAKKTRRTLYIILGSSVLVVTVIVLINHYHK